MKNNYRIRVETVNTNPDQNNEVRVYYAEKGIGEDPDPTKDKDWKIVKLPFCLYGERFWNLEDAQKCIKTVTYDNDIKPELYHKTEFYYYSNKKY